MRFTRYMSAGLSVLFATAALAGGMGNYDVSLIPGVPCKKQIGIKKLDRDQNKFFGQCTFEKRIKVSGSLITATGIVVNAMGHGFAKDWHKLTLNTNMSLDFRLNPFFYFNHLNTDTMSDLWLHRARLNFDSVLSSYAESHVSFAYGNDVNIFTPGDPMYYNRYRGRFQSDMVHGTSNQTVITNRGNRGSHIPIDEANITLGDLTRFPVYLRLGRQYLDFGWYERDRTMAPLTQFLSQASHDAISLGVVDAGGISASITGFNSVHRGNNYNASHTVTQDRPQKYINNFSASLAYGVDFESLSLDAKVDYLYDMFGVDFFDGYNGQGIVGLESMNQGNISHVIRPKHVTPMGALTFIARWGQVDFMGQYVGAISKLEKSVWSKGGILGSTFNDPAVDGVRPHGWITEIGVSFPIHGRDSRIAISHQKTQETMAGNTAEPLQAGPFIAKTRDYYIPLKRFEIIIQHNFMDNIDIGVHLIRDKDYNRRHFQRLNNTSATGASDGDLFTNDANYQGTDNENEMFLMTLTGRFN